MSKRLMLVLLAGLAISAPVTVAFLRSGTRARAAEVSQSNEGPLAGYRIPTGPELEPLTVARTAAVEWGRPAGIQGELKIHVVHSTFALAAAVAEGKATDEAELTGSSLGLTEWHATPVYLVVMEAVAPGAMFKPNVSVPKGKTGPSGTVMSLILDSHTGRMEGRLLGESAPKLAELGPVLSATIAAANPSAVMAAHSEPPPGELTGTVYVGGRVAKNWPVLLSGPGAAPRGRTVVAAHTNSHGDFTIRLKTGKYTVSARRPNGRECGAHKTTIRHRPTHTVVRCTA